MRQFLLFILAIALSITNLNAQNANQPDSVVINKLISNFYSWYISSIKNQKNLDFQPRFIENKERNTTLDFDRYLKNLKCYKFSDSLIRNETISYRDCIAKLSTVKFSDFNKTVFVDLDEYEQFKCDFSNYYRWIGGQEICDGIKIDKVKFISDHKCEVVIKKFNLSNGPDYFWWPYTIKVLCIKIQNDWKINSIVIKN